MIRNRPGRPAIRLHPRRAAAVERCLAEGASITAAAERARVTRDTLSRWVFLGARGDARYRPLALARAAGLELRRRRAADLLNRARELLQGPSPSAPRARGRALRAAAKVLHLDYDALRMRLARARRHEAPQTVAAAG